jgi:hypothetical protein
MRQGSLLIIGTGRGTILPAAGPPRRLVRAGLGWG